MRISQVIELLSKLPQDMELGVIDEEGYNGYSPITETSFIPLMCQGRHYFSYDDNLILSWDEYMNGHRNSRHEMDYGSPKMVMLISPLGRDPQCVYKSDLSNKTIVLRTEYMTDEEKVHWAKTDEERTAEFRRLQADVDALRSMQTYTLAEAKWLGSILNPNENDLKSTLIISDEESV